MSPRPDCQSPSSKADCQSCNAHSETAGGLPYVSDFEQPCDNYDNEQEQQTYPNTSPSRRSSANSLLHADGRDEPEQIERDPTTDDDADEKHVRWSAGLEYITGGCQLRARLLQIEPGYCRHHILQYAGCGEVRNGAGRRHSAGNYVVSVTDDSPRSVKNAR